LSKFPAPNKKLVLPPEGAKQKRPQGVAENMRQGMAPDNAPVMEKARQL
jgi:hypothetical protein